MAVQFHIGLVCIFFHRKFDTRTWSVAFVFANMIIFSCLLVLFLPYSLPQCTCETAYDHISTLPPIYKAMYAGILLYVTIMIVACAFTIYGVFKSQPSKLFLFMLLIGVTSIGAFGGSIYVITILARIEQYLIFDNQTYMEMAKLVLKKEVFAKLDKILSGLTGLLPLVLEINNEEEPLNLDAILTKILNREVILILGGVKLLMNVAIIVILIGVNFLFISTFMVVTSHFQRLKRGVVETYAGVPDVILRRKFVDSEKTSLSGSLQSTPLNKNGSMSTPIYKMSKKSLTNKHSPEQEYAMVNFKSQLSRDSTKTSARNSERVVQRIRAEENGTTEAKRKNNVA